jgi:RNA polymerase sigma factor (TIGR02999 family)
MIQAPSEKTDDLLIGVATNGQRISQQEKSCHNKASNASPASRDKLCCVMMENDTQAHVTQLLEQIREGDHASGGQLLDLVYDELRSLASALFRSQRIRNTLQPTALVHEAWMKLAGHLDSMECRRHFFAISAKAMRQVLADRARAAGRQKRGGDCETIPFNEGQIGKQEFNPSGVDLIDLDEKLTQLSSLNERHGRIVELRLLGSMTIDEIAQELAVSKRIVEGDWTFAGAWLRRVLTEV